MLSVIDTASPADRVSRREWLRVGGLSALGLSLPTLLRAGERPIMPGAAPTPPAGSCTPDTPATSSAVTPPGAPPAAVPPDGRTGPGATPDRPPRPCARRDRRPRSRRRARRVGLAHTTWFPGMGFVRRERRPWNRLR